MWAPHPSLDSPLEIESGLNASAQVLSEIPNSDSLQRNQEDMVNITKEGRVSIEEGTQKETNVPFPSVQKV